MAQIALRKRASLGAADAVKTGDKKYTKNNPRGLRPRGLFYQNFLPFGQKITAYLP